MMLLEVVVHPPCSSSIPIRGFSVMVFPYYLSTEEMALHVLETFDWHLRRAARPPRPLLGDYRELCSDFIPFDAEEAACDFRIPEMVIFSAMVVNDALELDVLSRDLADDLKSALITLRWYIFEARLQHNKSSLLRANCLGSSGKARHAPWGLALQLLRRRGAASGRSFSYSGGRRDMLLARLNVPTPKMGRAHTSPIQRVLKPRVGWVDVLNWNDGKPVRNLFGELTFEEIATARYFQYHIREDDQSKPLATFMLCIVGAGKEPKRHRVQSSDREQFNWLRKLSYFDNKFFLTTTGLLILANYSKGVAQEAQALLSPLELGDATAEEITVDAAQQREEKRHR
ncbi:LOW QUALITY PROTEIN: hypothetical protein Cgig2_030136 [Carnegiea gigantea]|uniref:Uncharacterized protein n=1 Tax=Carnegiea gigantea TaxID=171969 RepID=A0A9Q1K0J2_9CARY|nr:LOW QUALITY PROTEIN: hypothetical protein Cgig2_030136 [Carnegiea gigantea]